MENSDSSVRLSDPSVLIRLLSEAAHGPLCKEGCFWDPLGSPGLSDWGFLESMG